jgi:hypothetical protein
MPLHANFASKLNPSRHQSSTTLPVPLTATTPIQKSSLQIKPVPVVRSQWPNHMRKNYVKSRSVASTIYRRSLVIVSHWPCNFSKKFEVNPTSLVSFLVVLLLLKFMYLKSEVYSLIYSKFWWTSGDVPASKLYCRLLPSAPAKFYK